MPEKNQEQEYEIDLLELLRAMWSHIVAIVLTAVVCAGLALGYTTVFVTPKYKANALMYVNSSDISLAGSKLSISASDLTAAKSLVDTYIVILNTRTTLNDVIEQSGVSYTYEQLKSMISASAVNSTEIFSVEVTSTDPKEAELLANTIATILPEKIAAVVDGCSVRIVDNAVVPAKRSSPSYTKNTVLGFLLGAVLACGVVTVAYLMDDKIHSGDYLIQTYGLPMLATIPDLTAADEGSGYYGGYAAAGKRAEKGV